MTTRRAPQPQRRKRARRPYNPSVLEEVSFTPEQDEFTLAMYTEQWYAEMMETWFPRVRENRTNEVRYTHHFAMLCYNMRLLGASDTVIAAACDVALPTLQVWQEQHADFRRAYLYGGVPADAKVAKGMLQRAVGYSHPEEKIMVVKDTIVRVPTIKHYPPDVAAGTLWLTNRHKERWRNRLTQELTGSDGERLQPPQLVINPVQLHGALTNGHDTANGADDNDGT